jgi:chitin biosynthesis protein CHS5
MAPVSKYGLGAELPPSRSTVALRRPTSESLSGAERPGSISQKSPPPPRKDSISKSPTSARNDGSASTSHVAPVTQEPTQPTAPATTINESEEELEDDFSQEPSSRGRPDKNRKRRTGTMNKEFKFPPDPSPPTAKPSSTTEIPRDTQEHQEPSEPLTPTAPATQTGIPDVVTHVELPPPTPLKKDPALQEQEPDLDEDVGETEEVDLN